MPQRSGDPNLRGPFCLSHTYMCGEGNGNPLQYSRLENPTDGGAWRATVHGVAKSQARLSDFTFTFTVVYQALTFHQASCYTTVRNVNDPSHG